MAAGLPGGDIRSKRRRLMTRRCLLILLAVGGGLWHTAVRADAVVFKKGTRLECKVVGDTPEGLLVILGNENRGSMVIDRSTVDRIEYDYDSRLAAIERKEKETGEKLYTEHYRLGVWCEEHAASDPTMYERALDRYLYTKDKPGVPDEVYLRLGRMYEKCKEPNPGEAFDAYAAYAKQHPESAEAEAALKRLEAQRKNEPAPTPTPDKPGEGLEARPWRWERWSNPGAVRQVKDTGNERTTVLELKYRGGGKDKSAFAHPFNGNLQDKHTLLFDVFNPGKKPVKVAVAVVTGGNYDWYESKMVLARKGDWTLGKDRMRFDLTLSTWKSKATGWAHRTKPENLNVTRNLVILVYNGRSEGTVYVDNIRFEK